MLLWSIVLGPMLLGTVLLHEVRGQRCSSVVYPSSGLSPWLPAYAARLSHLSVITALSSSTTMLSSSNLLPPPLQLGHCLAARQVGAHVSGILLWPLGGLAFIGQTPSPKGAGGRAGRFRVQWVHWSGPCGLG